MPSPDGLWWGRKTDLSPEREVVRDRVLRDEAIQDREDAFERHRNSWLGSERTTPKARTLLAQQ